MNNDKIKIKIQEINKENVVLNISIIICTKDRSRDLFLCLESINNQTYDIKDIIIIDSGDDNFFVDNNSNLNFDKIKLNINYIKYKSGLTAARNLGIKESKGDIIIFLDDDVILDKDYVYNIAEIFKNYEHVGGVSGNVINYIDRSDNLPGLIKIPSIRKIRNLLFHILYLTSWGDGKFRPSGFPTFPVDKNEIMFVECLRGNNMAFMRNILDKFKFDENLHGYCLMEDCDISYRVSREYHIIYTPFAKLIHNVSTISRYSDYKRMEMAIINHYYLFDKNIHKKIYNRFSFYISIFGLFLICVLSLRKEGIKGLCSGLKKQYNKKNFEVIV